VRFALTGGAAIWIIAFLGMSLSMSGMVTVTGALWLLVVAGLGATVLIYFAEPLWGVPGRQRLAVTAIAAAIISAGLFWVGVLEKAHGAGNASPSAQHLVPPSNTTPSNAATQAPSPPVISRCAITGGQYNINRC
jgi:hypothetical protein